MDVIDTFSVSMVKIPPSPPLRKGGNAYTSRCLIAIREFMSLNSTMRSPFLKGDRGILSIAYIRAYRRQGGRSRFGFFFLLRRFCLDPGVACFSFFSRSMKKLPAIV